VPLIKAMKEKEIKKPTQESRILTFLRDRGDSGVYAWEITGNLHILQYNARIFGLREKGYTIINTTPGHFILREEKGQVALFQDRFV